MECMYLYLVSFLFAYLSIQLQTKKLSNISKYIVNVINSSYIEKAWHVKYSIEFIRYDDVVIKLNYVLAFLDVKSLP